MSDSHAYLFHLVLTEIKRMETPSLAALRWISFLLTIVVVLKPSAPAEASEQEKPSCALIAADSSPISTLLEARLLARDSEIWLERREIDRVLAEQELQAAFGAAGGADRAALGRLLKADVLVLLRSSVQNGQPCAELVVAESEGGLRLLGDRGTEIGGHNTDLGGIASTDKGAGVFILHTRSEEWYFHVMPPAIASCLRRISEPSTRLPASP